MSTRIATTDKKMRKEPRQARSRATVSAIVEAGTRVLGQKGWAEFTTNEVADVAGVSIGSLYQYFPNKLSLVEAIRQRHFDEVLEVVRWPSEGTGPLEERMDSLVEGMFAVHDANPALHRALLEEVPLGKGTGAAHDQFEAQYLRYYKALVSKHRNHRDAKRDEVTAQMLSAAIEGVVHHAALREQLNLPELKAQLVSLVCACIRTG